MSSKGRGAGAGSIYRRKDGRWAASVTKGWEDGKQQRETVYGRTRADVERRLQLLQNRVAAGLPALDERTRVGTYLARWVETVQGRLRPSTALRYRGIVENQLIPELGSVKLAKLAPDDVSAMLARLQAAGLSPRTAAHARAVLRTALTDALKSGRVVRNAAQLADPPRVPRPSPKVLPPADVHRMLDSVAGTELANLIALGVWTGCRQGELLGLRWSDVDLERRQLTVGASLQRLQGESRLVEPKSEHSRRTLRLSAPAMEALRAERQRQAEAQLAAGSRWRPTIEGLVFTDHRGRPLVGTTVTASFQRALGAAGLERLRFHHLRHLHGALMLASGVDLATVSHLLGHSSVALTASTYAGILPTLREDATDRLERLMGVPG